MQNHNREILSSKGNELENKRIVLCVCGSVAAFRSVEIARELIRHGADVICVTSKNAGKIINPNLLEWATGNKVVEELTGELEHIRLAGEHKERADLILVAPATANAISKVACGIDDTTVTTVISTALGSGIKVMFVPAMHYSLYANPFVAENVKKLLKNEIEIIEPRVEEGKAKIPNSEEIVDYVIRALGKKDMRGKKVVVTAGATREYLDDIRFISNPSSGKMGLAIAREAWLRGTDVSLIHGHVDIEIPRYIKAIKAETTEEMHKQVLGNKADIYVLAGAPTDFRTKRVRGKISSERSLSITIVPTIKISESIKKKYRKAKLVLFKAESNVSEKELVETARKKLAKANGDLIVANDVSKSNAGFASEENEIWIIGRKNEVVKKRATKNKLAGLILDSIE
ncbi:bifunctional phosphopantothenoylcysteine decarboxylase/phosphopantothenate--cysteine ligase CoaBC, partial [Candidatus Micrarchaeota archaeon]|nr:bifunctional phosphopantothenoylcysteine decarboxylase/phosphopantothenate--cysteine ligase CoaBC [Candidatus Micrarchaeota archaeon]